MKRTSLSRYRDADKVVIDHTIFAHLVSMS